MTRIASWIFSIGVAASCASNMTPSHGALGEGLWCMVGMFPNGIDSPEAVPAARVSVERQPVECDVPYYRRNPGLGGTPVSAVGAQVRVFASQLSDDRRLMLITEPAPWFEQTLVLLEIVESDAEKWDVASCHMYKSSDVLPLAAWLQVTYGTIVIDDSRIGEKPLLTFKLYGVADYSTDVQGERGRPASAIAITGCVTLPPDGSSGPVPERYVKAFERAAGLVYAAK